MQQRIAIDLIRQGVRGGREQRWADLGSGDGVFTNAVGSLLGQGSIMYAVDSNKRALDNMLPIPGITVEKIAGDLTDESMIPASLDGIVLANAIHYVADARRLLGALLTKLNTAGRIIVVEYDMDQPNPWVPYPLSFVSLGTITHLLGLATPEKIGEVPSQLNRSNIYSAVIVK